MILPVINLSDKCPTFLWHSPFVVLLRIKLLEERDKMKRLLETLEKQVIIVTHSPQEAYLLCSSLRVMKNCGIIKSGKTEVTFFMPLRDLRQQNSWAIEVSSTLKRSEIKP